MPVIAHAAKRHQGTRLQDPDPVVLVAGRVMLIGTHDAEDRPAVDILGTGPKTTKSRFLKV